MEYDILNCITGDPCTKREGWELMSYGHCSQVTSGCMSETSGLCGEMPSKQQKSEPSLAPPQRQNESVPVLESTQLCGGLFSSPP